MHSSRRAALTASMRTLCSSWEPWLKLRRATFMPALISSGSTGSVAGPSVQMIFVLRIKHIPLCKISQLTLRCGFSDIILTFFLTACNQLRKGVNFFMLFYKNGRACV